MAKARITKRFIDSLKPESGKQLIYFDDELAGFGVCVGMTKTTYILQTIVNRKTRRIKIGVHGAISPEQARDRAKELLYKISIGEDPVAKKRQEEEHGFTVAQALDSYLKARKSLSKGTIDKVRQCRTLYFPDWQHKPLASLTKQMMLERHEKLAKTRGQGSANRALRQLRAVYNHASITHDSLPPNPVDVLSKAKAWCPDRRRRTFIKPHQLPVWFEAVDLFDNAIIADYLKLLLFTGLRRMEAQMLRWEHVDFDHKTLTIPQTKNGEPHTLPLSTYLLDMLQRRKKKCGTNPWVFPSISATGHLIEPRMAMRRIEKQTGITFTCHDLRRTFITIAESIGCPAYSLKALLNHKSSDVTAGYIVVTVERLRKPMEDISQYILGLVEGVNRHGAT